jgi:hypothetical protein
MMKKYENTAFRTNGLYPQAAVDTIPAVTLAKPSGKVKVTVSLSRAAVATLDRIRGKRLEAGVRRRQAQQSALIEEAIHDLRRKERMR